MRRQRTATTTVLVLAALLASFVPMSRAGAVESDPFEPSIATGQTVTASARTRATDVHAFGGARSHGSKFGKNLRYPVEAIAPTPTGRGYWLATGVGRVFAYGDARHRGDLRGIRLNQPIVGIAATPTGRGYWLVATDGGVFAFGDARFRGSTGGILLNQPIVGIAATPTGRGYWLVASDGGIFSFGDAHFHGSTGAIRLNEPIVGMASTRSGRGYWLVASDGGVFTFGNARFRGSTGARRLAHPVIGMARNKWGNGYWIATLDGKVFAFGRAKVYGTAPRRGVRAAFSGFAARPQGDGYWLAAADVGDTIEAWQPGGMSPTLRNGLLHAAASTGAARAVMHSGTIGLLTVRRGAGYVQRASPGWRIPMASTAVDARDALGLYGPRIVSALLRREVVFGARSARLRGARVGDVIEFLGWDGRVHARRIGAIAPTRRAGSTELIFAAGDAASFGFMFESEVTFWGFHSRDAMLSAIASVPKPPYFGLSPSWNPHPGDDVLPTVALKERLGEFQYLPRGGPITIDPTWVARNIAAISLPIVGTVTCNRALAAPLTAALGEIARAGLAGAIDPVDTRVNGGCYVPREIRGASGGSISRHAWGVALDVNPSSNPFGGTPHMDPRVVAIFRRHGFAWGGSWARPDGMHFEWVGG